MELSKMYEMLELEFLNDSMTNRLAEMSEEFKNAINLIKLAADKLKAAIDRDSAYNNLDLSNQLEESIDRYSHMLGRMDDSLIAEEDEYALKKYKKEVSDSNVFFSTNFIRLDNAIDELKDNELFNKPNADAALVNAIFDKYAPRKVSYEDTIKISNLNNLHHKLNSWKYDHIFYRNTDEFRNMLSSIENVLKYYNSKEMGRNVDSEKLGELFGEVEKYTTQYINNKKALPSTDAGKGRLKLALAALYTVNPEKGLNTIDKIAAKRKENNDIKVRRIEESFNVKLTRYSKNHYLSLKDVIDEAGIIAYNKPAEAVMAEEEKQAELAKAAEEEKHAELAKAAEEVEKAEEAQQAEAAQAADRHDLVENAGNEPLPQGHLCNTKEYKEFGNTLATLKKEVVEQFASNSLTDDNREENYAKYFLLRDISEEYLKLEHEECDNKSLEALDTLFMKALCSKNLLSRDPKDDVINRQAFYETMKSRPAGAPDSEIYEKMYENYVGNAYSVYMVQNVEEELDFYNADEEYIEFNKISDTHEYVTIVDSLNKSLKEIAAVAVGAKDMDDSSELLARYIVTKSALFSIKESGANELCDDNFADLERQINECKSMYESTTKLKNSPEFKAVINNLKGKEHLDTNIESLYKLYAIEAVNAKLHSNENQPKANVVEEVNTNKAENIAPANEAEAHKAMPEGLHK